MVWSVGGVGQDGHTARAADVPWQHTAHSTQNASAAIDAAALIHSAAYAVPKRAHAQPALQSQTAAAAAAIAHRHEGAVHEGSLQRHIACRVTAAAAGQRGTSQLQVKGHRLSSITARHVEHAGQRGISVQRAKAARNAHMRPNAQAQHASERLWGR